MESKRWVISLIAVWTGVIALFLYIPIFSVITSSFGKSRYFRFPVKAWSDKWYDQTLGANLTTDLHLTSFYVAGCVALIAVVLGFFGALAFARYNWRGRQFYQRLIMLPIFFPKPCSAWRSCSGSPMSACCRAGRRRSSPIWSGSCRS